MKIVQYYPRAVTGDGGMTGAVHRLTRSLDRAGAEAAIVYDAGRGNRDAAEGTGCVAVAHVGPENERVPRTKPLRDAFRGRDIVVVNSGFAPHNIAATMALSLNSEAAPAQSNLTVCDSSKVLCV